MQKGDVVVVTGALKKVVEFLATATKEDLRILSSFFTEEARGTTDAKKLMKPLKVTNIYPKEFVVEVEISKTERWEDREEYFKKLTAEELENEDETEAEGI